MPPVHAAPGSRLVLSPQEPLVAGGPAEELERRVQELFRQGYRHVVVDLRAVPSADSAGLRALVRGHTSAQRLNRRFTLIGPNARVMQLLHFSQLDRALEIKDSIAEARGNDVRWDRLLTIAGVLVITLILVGSGLLWPRLGFVAAGAGSGDPFGSQPSLDLSNPLFELAKLVAAALIGMLVTIVHRQYRTDRSANPTLDQAQVLLCRHWDNWQACGCLEPLQGCSCRSWRHCINLVGHHQHGHRHGLGVKAAQFILQGVKRTVQGVKLDAVEPHSMCQRGCTLWNIKCWDNCWSDACSMP